MTPREVRSNRFDAGDVLDPRLLALLVPGALITSVLTRAPADLREALGWTAVNLASIVVSGLWVLMLRATALRATRLRPRRLGPVGVLAIGASIGLVKGLTTSLFGWTAELLDTVLIVAEYRRWVSTTVQGMVLVPVIGLTRGALRRFRAEYEQLILERARRVLLSGDGPSGPREARVVRFIAEARRRIDTAADPTVAVVLEELVEERLRPLTRELWRTSDSPTDFTLGSLLRGALHTDAFPALPVATVFVFTTAAARIDYASLAENLLVTVVDLAAILVIFGIARRLRPNVRRLDVAHLVLTVAATAIAALASDLVILADAGATLGPFAAGIVLFVWLFMLTVLLSAGRIALRTRGSVREELERLVDGRADDAVVAASRRLRDRELADQLHSGLQNRLIAAARRIEGSGGSATVVREEVAAVGRLLDDLADGAERPSVPARAQVEDLVARWAGFVTVDARLDPALDTLEQQLQDRIAQLVAEAVNNAVRHGRAERVVVEVASVDPDRLRVVAEDDGIGPVERPPGLGSRLFDALSGADWSLRPRQDGGSRLEVTVLL